jgi:predicted Zn finger-like uncharacterized protein
MFKVECPGCKAPYQVDERRIPASGLKMRCPKCGTSFKVDSPSERSAPPVGLGTVLGLNADSMPPPALGGAPPPPAPAMPRGAALKSTMVGVGPLPIPPPRPAAPLAPSRAKAAADLPAVPAPAAGADLPSPAASPVRKGAPPPLTRGKPPLPAAAAPAPVAAAPVAPAASSSGFGSGLELDLPTPTDSIELPLVRTPGARLSSPSLELDLPAHARSADATPGVAPPRAPAAPVAPPPASAGGFGDIELDLPSTATAAPAPRAAVKSEFDLPAARGRGIDLPAVAPKAAPPPPRPGFAASELELPALSGGAALPRASGATESSTAQSLGLDSSIDLPSMGGGAARAPAAPIAPPRARMSSSNSVDLPSLGSKPGLPVPAGVGLPSRSNAGLPAPSGIGLTSNAGINLPSLSGASLPTAGGPSLPARGGASLPAAGGPGLPSFAPQGFELDGPRLPDLAAPSPSGAAIPSFAPVSDRDILPLDLEGPVSAPGVASGFGVLDLEAIPARPSNAPAMNRFENALDSDPFGEAPLPPPRSLRPGDVAGAAAPPIVNPAALGSPVIRQAGGGTAYGEVDLGGDASDEVALEAPGAPPRAPMPSDEDMEFGGVPQEQAPADRAAPLQGRAPAAAIAPVGSPTAAASSQRTPRVVKPRGKLPIRALAGIFVVLVGGAALTLVPDAGPFGSYWIIDRIKADENQRLVLETAKSARAHLEKDTAPEAALAAKEVDDRRAEAKRVRGLWAYAAFVGAERELRFGSDPEVHARGKVLLDELATHDGAQYLELARAARAAVDGQLARARQGVAAVMSRSPNDPDALLLSGEVELRAHDPKAALAAWQALGKIENSARAAFGLARARFANDDAAGAEREAKAVLERNPDHVGAKILLARIAARSRGRENEAITWLDAVAKTPERSSADEQVSAATLRGEIHLARSRISRAEAAFTDALRINPKAARALIGLGEAQYRAGRYSEAQARFEAGAQADPDDVFAKVGVAKSKLMLERLEDASTSLKRLRESHPNSLSVAYWYGRVLEALGDRDQAEKIYKQALTKGKGEPEVVDVYIALALLQNQQGRSEEAQKTLAQARDRLPSSPAIHVALGDVALTQGRYPDATTEFRKALELDSEDLGARHKLGMALRREGKFEEALKIFGEVRAVDPDYPGLALETGLLFEASDRKAEALKEYERALAKAPDDPDLQLHVGCGYAASSRTKEAEELLRKVLALRPTSAETNHCLGRALLAEGSRLADALRLLERAAELDPHRAEYHLYVGWAANEAGQVQKAERALNQAIALDQGLADAYWQRGVLRQRQGAVRDAIIDLTRCLQLRPTRYEAHATLAQAYYDQGNEQLALSEWQKAVAAQPDNATWHFHYGKLLDDNHSVDAARSELTRALDLIEKKDGGERWGWDAHRRLARALGPRQEAVPHWEAFLRQGPLDSPYRAEAMAALERLGHPWRADSSGVPLVAPPAPGKH